MKSELVGENGNSVNESDAAKSVLIVKNGMGGTKRVVDLSEVFAEVLSKTDTVAKVTDGSALIDAASPGRKVYQVTVSKTHDLPLVPMKVLCEDAGYIEDGKVVPEKTVDKLEFYWVVPFGVAEDWKKRAPYKFQGHNDTDKKLVNECLKMHVDMYVLPMTAEKPEAYSQNNPENEA